ncbi:MAG: ribokinase [Gammaproteobacteria bacterium]
MNKAVVIGSINMDIVAYVKSVPKPGECVFGSAVKYFPGGKGANQAVACRRLGCATKLIGRVGADAFGEQLSAFYESEGIDIEGVEQLPAVSTGLALVTVTADAENSIIVMSGANSVWHETALDTSVIEPGDLVLCQFEIPDRVIEKAFERAKAQGALTLLNPAPVRKIAPAIASKTDILVVNELELAESSGMPVQADDDRSVFEAAEHLQRQGFGCVVATLGARGVRLLDAGRRHAIAARRVEAVDTTGAGDTFIGGFAAAMLAGRDRLRAAEFGNIAASVSVTREGAAAAIPKLDEVQALMSEL